ncbi:MAG TPA: hypothetical protein VIK22_00085 [Candidatus Anoxymicrobiaceae bacterium]
MFGKLTKFALYAGVFGYAIELGTLQPTVSDLINPQWHREAPVRLMMRRFADLLPALYDRYGERGVKALQYVFYQMGLDRSATMQEALQIDPTDARSLGRVLDFEDHMVGVRGVWTEETCGRAVKEERYCPASRELEKCPQVCTSLMMALEAGTFALINPDLDPPEISKLLSTGDDCCLAEIELPVEVVGSKSRAKSTSPQAMPGAFPPIIDAPGLRTRLAVLSFVSLFKALFKLATTGLDQPMHWYDFFRYQPEG